jgi:hypothetical protein
MYRFRLPSLGPLAVLAVLTAAPAHAAINVTPTGNANDLAGFIAGPGISIHGATYSGDPLASGLFTGGLGVGLGIQSGIVLTTGRASFASESNTFDDRTQDNNRPGSAILNRLVPGYTTGDATLLTIDFSLVAGGDLYFNYVFASEEYDEFVGSDFNDVFGFFLNGNQVANNVALIPGTTTPVAINNINDTDNSLYFNANDAGGNFDFTSGNQRPVNPANAPFPRLQYDGFTTVLTVEALNIGAGRHNIILAIGDAGDRILDSAVFIQAASFSTSYQPPYVPEGRTWFAVGGLFAMLLVPVLRRHGPRVLGMRA